jgi:predicted AlkP superfamily phosphohydrolase/phosphomutase
MKRIFAVGIDGAEYSLIQKWTQDGSLPTIKELIKNGGDSSLESFAAHLPGSNWYSFYLGQQPGVHGLYSYLAWRPEKMTAELPSPKWVPVTSFWHHLQDDGPRGIVMNVPDAFMVRKFNGIEVLALANDHALTPMISHPPHMVDYIRSHFGQLSLSEENYDLLSLKEFLHVRDEMIDLTFRLRDVYLKMMKEETWNFFLAVFPVLHRAGHRLWSTTNIHDLKTEQEKNEAEDALRQVYMAFDRALADLLEAIPPSTLTLLFSFYGMHENHSREAILPEMLNRVLQKDSRETIRNGTGLKPLLLRLRKSIPNSIRHRVKSGLPYSWRYKLTSFWRMSQLDWARMPAFVIPLEVQIGVRVNLKGREKLGIVQPGREFDELCRNIMEGLSTFVDADTGKPLVMEMKFSKDIFAGDRVDWLPDLIGTWNSEPSAHHRMITSPVYGDIPWPTPGKNPEGRSGNHTSGGFLIASGGGVNKDALRDVHILDLAPTILHLLGVPISDDIGGKIIHLMEE